MVREPLLPPESLERYADAIVRASLGIEKGDTLVVQGQPEHPASEHLEGANRW